MGDQALPADRQYSLPEARRAGVLALPGGLTGRGVLDSQVTGRPGQERGEARR